MNKGGETVSVCKINKKNLTKKCMTNYYESTRIRQNPQKVKRQPLAIFLERS